MERMKLKHHQDTDGCTSRMVHVVLEPSVKKDTVALKMGEE